MTVYVVLVTLAALAVSATLPRTGLGEHLVALMTLLGLTAWVGSRAIHIRTLKVEVTAGDAFMFCGLVLVGPMAAPLIALTGVLGTMASGRRQKPLRVVFNLAAMALSAAAGARGYLALTDVASSGSATDSIGLLVAAAIFVLTNTVLVALAIRLERGRPMLAVWRSFIALAANSALASLLVGLGLYSLYAGLGPVGLLAGLSASVLIGAALQRLGDRLSHAESATASSN